MQPVWFGRPEEPLFGWYHPPERAPARGPGVVLCPPFGYEAICTHRTLRALAMRLAEAGLPVMRFDYHGTGNSAGDDRDPDRVRAWLDSIGTAADELMNRSEVASVSLVGLRLGATLAMIAATGRRDVSALVLWAPCLAGRNFLREMKMIRLTAESEMKTPNLPPASVRGDNDEEAAGFLLSAATMESLRALNLLEIKQCPAAAALIIGRDDMPDEPRLPQHLESLGAQVRNEPLPGYRDLMQDPHRSEIPDGTLDRIRDWLLADSHELAVRTAGRPSTVTSAAVPVPDAPAGVTVREESVFIEAGGRLLSGMLTEPASPAADAERAVILLNAGAIRSVGPNRLHVPLTRQWATRGITSLRLDLGSLGDSDGGGATGGRIYSMLAVPDARAAIAFLQARAGVKRVTLVGLCSGAYVAFHTAMADPAVERTVLINPQTLFWKEGDTIDVRRRTFQAAQHYKRSLFRTESWLKLARGDVDIPRALDLVGSRIVFHAQDKLSPLRQALGLEPENEVLTAMRATIACGVQTVLLLCRDDPGLDYLHAHLGEGLRRLPESNSVTVEIIDGPDHTFTPLWAQKLLSELLTKHVVDRP